MNVLFSMIIDVVYKYIVFFLFTVSLAHWLEERQKVYEARQRRVETICHKNNVSTVSSNDTMEDLINFSVHNDSATGMKLLFFTALKKKIVKREGLKISNFVAIIV